jgi:hypothetical protein
LDKRSVSQQQGMISPVVFLFTISYIGIDGEMRQNEKENRLGTGGGPFGIVSDGRLRA